VFQEKRIDIPLVTAALVVHDRLKVSGRDVADTRATEQSKERSSRDNLVVVVSAVRRHEVFKGDDHAHC